MTKFFHSWRRKIGLLTLVMACVFMGWWIRSLSSWDHIYFPIGNRTHEITSYRGGLSWVSWEHKQPEWGFKLDVVELRGDANTFVEMVAGWSSPHYASWKMRYWWAFYWQVVIPLTLLSAYLLLSKPRPAKPNDGPGNSH